jgi:hypothetical protein
MCQTVRRRLKQFAAVGRQRSTILFHYNKINCIQYYVFYIYILGIMYGTRRAIIIIVIIYYNLLL